MRASVHGSCSSRLWSFTATAISRFRVLVAFSCEGLMTVQARGLKVRVACHHEGSTFFRNSFICLPLITLKVNAAMYYYVLWP